jgi:hypothetical protein
MYISSSDHAFNAIKLGKLQHAQGLFTKKYPKKAPNATLAYGLEVMAQLPEAHPTK